MPQLLLQPLVENAITHAMGDHRQPRPAAAQRRAARRDAAARRSRTTVPGSPTTAPASSAAGVGPHQHRRAPAPALRRRDQAARRCRHRTAAGCGSRSRLPYRRRLAEAERPVSVARPDRGRRGARATAAARAARERDGRPVVGEAASGPRRSSHPRAARRTSSSSTCRCPAWTASRWSRPSRPTMPAVVFVTAYDEFALEAFEVPRSTTCSSPSRGSACAGRWRPHRRRRGTARRPIGRAAADARYSAAGPTPSRTAARA